MNGQVVRNVVDVEQHEGKFLSLLSFCFMFNLWSPKDIELITFNFCRRLAVEFPPTVNHMYISRRTMPFLKSKMASSCGGF